MKTLLKTALTLILFLPLMSGVSAATDKLPTLREQMKVIHERFDVNFIYDSSLDLDIPYKGQPMTGESLEALFKDTGISYEINRKYVEKEDVLETMKEYYKEARIGLEWGNFVGALNWDHMYAGGNGGNRRIAVIKNASPLLQLPFFFATFVILFLT